MENHQQHWADQEDAADSSHTKAFQECLVSVLLRSVMARAADSLNLTLVSRSNFMEFAIFLKLLASIVGRNCALESLQYPFIVRCCGGEFEGVRLSPYTAEDIIVVSPCFDWAITVT